MVVECSELDGGILIIRLNNGQNRMNPEFFQAFNSALDRVEREKPSGLITIGSGRFFSNGLDVEYLFQNRKTPLVNRVFPDHFYPLMRRIMLLPCPTVAVLNGHAYAGGMGLAMAHDYRIMLDGKGLKMCMNEISLGAPIPKGLVEILRCKFKTSNELQEALLLPVSFDAQMALCAGLVNKVGTTDEELLQFSREIIESHKNNTGESYSLIKQAVFSQTIAELESKDDIPIDVLFKSLL